MKKNFASSALALLLILSLLAISPQLVGVKTAKADEAAVSFRFTTPLEWFEEHGWEGETDASHDVASYINDRFPLDVYEWTGFYAEPSKSTFLSVVDMFDDDYDYGAVFIYGHGHNQTKHGSWYYWDGFDWIWLNNTNIEYFSFWDSYNVYIDDAEIHYKTFSANNYFVFMIPCESGKVNGYYDEDDYTYVEPYDYWYQGAGASGMPYCWTHRDDLAEDGYDEETRDNGDYCFIGFETFGPPMINQTGYNDKTVGDFVKRLYLRLLAYGDSIHESLDTASSYAYGQSPFNATDLYNGWTQYVPGWGDWDTKMRIYGNANNTIPN